MERHARKAYLTARRQLNQSPSIVIDRLPSRNGVVAKFERHPVILKA
jgi:hypothetical protein